MSHEDLFFKWLENYNSVCENEMMEGSLEKYKILN